MKHLLILLAALMVGPHVAKSQTEGFVSAGRDAALGAIQAGESGGASGGSTRSPEMLANEYAFQYRQMTQERLSKIFQNSAGAVRDTDPFGTPMGTALRQQAVRDKTEEGVADEAKRAAMEGFGNAVRGLDIRGVNSGRKEFLCGVDNIFEGDVLDISFGSGIYRAWIVSVKPDSITFMDHSSQQSETISIGLDVPAVNIQRWGSSGNLEDAPPF